MTDPKPNGLTYAQAGVDIDAGNDMVEAIKPLARALGFPYFPVTPTFPWLGPLGAIPLPSKWIIEFGEPIPTDEYPENSADDPMVVFNVTDRVRETIQQTLYRLLLRRGHPFLG